MYLCNKKISRQIFDSKEDFYVPPVQYNGVVESCVEIATEIEPLSKRNFTLMGKAWGGLLTGDRCGCMETLRKCINDFADSLSCDANRDRFMDALFA